MRIKINIKGQAEIKRKIKLLEKRGGEQLKKAITKSAIYVEGQAKQTTAWKNVTGRLRPSITHEIISKGPKHVGRVGTDVFYGPFLEFGTARMPARPWLIPALKNSTQAILRFITQAIKDLKT